MSVRTVRCPLLVAFAALLAIGTWPLGSATAGESGPEPDELQIALSLAELLRASRTVIGNAQSSINDPQRSEPGPDGRRVFDDAIDILKQAGSDVPQTIDDGSTRGRYLALQRDAIIEVIDENRSVIDQPGVGFKGFVPAVFARLSNERFSEKAGGEARIKVTAPMSLVRNRRARPDAWEREVIESRFMSGGWPRGERHVDTVSMNGREAFRLMVPEYYGSGCLACHGGPAGELDITGYPKEGAEHDALGGAISIALFR